jgi:NAD(P)-dependent dehydrogenase (short-subunit alcohol dehydrogenase family)
MITARGKDRVAAAVDELSRSTGDPTRVAGTVTDVRRREQVDALMAETAARFGGFDTLVNNAGVGVFADVGAMSDEEWANVIDTNLTGPFLCSRAALPWLKQAGGGWIVNIASLAGRNAFAGGGAYCASKAGLVAFTESLMQEVRFDNIRVSVVMPGSVATEFSPRGAGGDDSWKLSPADVAEVVVDLLRHPARSLPSKVELRPAKPKGK